MPLEIHQFPCLSDNYGFLVRDVATGKTACIDTPDADAILMQLEKRGWGLDMILNTHWHPDHAGGNEAVKAATGAIIVGPQEVTRIAPLDRVVAGGDVVELGATRLSVIDSGGHTLGHVAYHDAEDRIAFVGDTLFALGCGRMFEGDPEQMWASLSRLADLPDDTTVYCAHEYTQSNARFAMTVEADNDKLIKRSAAIDVARAKGEATVPSLLGEEKATNPFLRAPTLRPGLSPAQAFAEIRAAKDSFKG